MADGKRYGITEKFGYNTIGFNKDEVDVADMQTLASLSDPKYQGRIAIYDYYLPVIGIAALATGKKTATLTADDLPAIKDVLLKWKANARLVGEVTASQTALATGEADILVGGGEWVTAVLAAENPALDFSIPEEGGILWSQSLAMFADSREPGPGAEVHPVHHEPEGQARLATSSCYWGMPAKQQAALTDAQKAVLRFDEQPDFSSALSSTRAGRGPRQENAGPLDRHPAGPIVAGATAGASRAAALRGDGGRAYHAALDAVGLRRPGAVWTAAFFILPLLVMVWLSLTVHGAGDGVSLANYTQFVANESYWRALVASLEVTVVVTLVSVVLAYRLPGSWPRSCRAGSASA